MIRQGRMGMQSQAMSLMEVTPEMTSLFFVNQESLERVRGEKASNAVLDVVDDFCDFIEDVNKEAEAYAAKHGKSKAGRNQEAYFQKKFKKKYTYDW